MYSASKSIIAKTGTTLPMTRYKTAGVFFALGAFFFIMSLFCCFKYDSLLFNDS